MEPQDDKRKSIQQLPDDRQQIRFADLLAGGDELHLRHTVHRVDVVHAFDAIQIALMHAIYADVARHSVWLRCTAFADGNAGGARLAPVPPFVLVRCAPAQVVKVGNRDARQPFKARITKNQKSAFHELLGGGPGQRVMQHIYLGQQEHVCCGVTIGETLLGRTGLFR